MTNERWLRWAVAKHFRDRGLEVKMRPVKVGNAAIDGEVVGREWRMALEIKSGSDDVIRGIGQCTEALARGHGSAAVVTSVQRAKRIRPEVTSVVGSPTNREGNVTLSKVTVLSRHLASSQMDCYFPSPS